MLKSTHNKLANLLFSSSIDNEGANELNREFLKSSNWKAHLFIDILIHCSMVLDIHGDIFIDIHLFTKQMAEREIVDHCNNARN